MFPRKHPSQLSILPYIGRALAVTVLALAIAAVLPMPGQAQSSDQQPQAQKPSQQDQMPAEAGGPGGDTGAIAVPKKTDNDEEPPPPPKPKPADIPSYSLHVDVPVVTIDARILQKNGLPLALPVEQAREHFKVWEDGVPQKIQTITVSQAPITAVLLVEFAATNYSFMYDALNSSYTFASNLQPQDWVAVEEFDMRTHILVDFTQDKQTIFAALNTLRIPTFKETDLFDAMFDTLDRLDRVPGHKELVVVASGVDTFSKIRLDQILKKIKATPNVTIYTISTGVAWEQRMDAMYGSTWTGSMARMDYLQADNQMNVFAKMTGGRHYAPRLLGELPDIFREVAQSIRSQYTITYKPTNTKQDGTYRKLKVALVGPNDKPLEIKDEKNKDVKYEVYARDGYTAKMPVE